MTEERQRADAITDDIQHHKARREFEAEVLERLERLEQDICEIAKRQVFPTRPTIGGL